MKSLLELNIKNFHDNYLLNCFFNLSINLSIFPLFLLKKDVNVDLCSCAIQIPTTRISKILKLPSCFLNFHLAPSYFGMPVQAFSNMPELLAGLYNRKYITVCHSTFGSYLCCNGHSNPSGPQRPPARATRLPLNGECIAHSSSASAGDLTCNCGSLPLIFSIESQPRRVSPEMNSCFDHRTADFTWMSVCRVIRDMLLQHPCPRYHPGRCHFVTTTTIALAIAPRLA